MALTVLKINISHKHSKHTLLLLEKMCNFDRLTKIIVCNLHVEKPKYLGGYVAYIKSMSF